MIPAEANEKVGERRRILIIGDSNCLPRRGHSKYRDTWIGLLRTKLHDDDVILLADGTRTTEYLALYPLKQSDGTIEYDPNSLESYEPNGIIISLGIVDCAPRLFTKHESYLVGKLPQAAQNAIIAAAKRIRRRSMQRVYVPSAKFETLVRQYLVRCRAMHVDFMLIIGIPTPDRRCASKNPAIVAAVAHYNGILTCLADEFHDTQIIDPLHPEKDESELYVEDGYHLSPHGHQILYHAVLAALDRSIA